MSLIFEFDEEITEIIGNEKDETKLIFEKYHLSLTSNIPTKTQKLIKLSMLELFQNPHNEQIQNCH